MTTASELFHTRRSRSGRNSHLELAGIGGEEQPPPSLHSSHSNRRHHHHYHHRRSNHHHNHLSAPTTSAAAAAARRDPNRIQYDSYDPFNPGRAFHFSGPLGPLRRTIPDRDPVFPEQDGITSASEDASSRQNGRTLGDRLRSFGGERLPGTVLLARERLLQRLRGVSLSSNRLRNRASSSIHHNNVTAEDESRLANGVDWENYDFSPEWLMSAIPSNKPRRAAGLTQKSRDSLPVEIFSKQKKSGEEEAGSKGLEDCSICLESYDEGDKLTYLTCGHRFHCTCLDPWLQICGDCPYCRKSILPNTCR